MVLAPSSGNHMPAPPDSPGRPRKRARLDAASSSEAPARSTTPPEAPAEPEPPALHRAITADNGLEDTLPAETHEDAEVKKYEAQKTADGRWRSSIYVDAFNLALDTVLLQEAYLFSESESAIFAQYRSLDYEAQHLYVRLFLRKTDKWFRVSQLNYEKDIGDMAAACGTLLSPDIGFAEGESALEGLEEAAGLLSLEELRTLAKDAKAAGSTKAQLVAGLKRASSGQGTLSAGGKQLQLSFDRRGNYVSRDAFFVRKIFAMTGPCIRLCAAVRTLFARVHLVFYRSTEWSEHSLSTVILSRTARRHFPSYVVSRTSSIFPSRQALLDFEAAIKLQSRVDELLEGAGVPTQAALEEVLGIFDGVYEPWCALVAAEAAAAAAASPDAQAERVYLVRFSAAWVYTRIVHKGAHVLGRLKHYAREHAVLAALLAQRSFQAARRGAWYQRKALVEEHYMAALEAAPAPPAPALARQWRRAALRTCEAGLQDSRTHLVFHHDLQKRLLKLERALHVPKREQHDFGHARLRAPSARTVRGARVGAAAVGRKTRWRGPDGQDVGVEAMCLAAYTAEGWRGLHAEGGVVRTLFALLFFDLLFVYVPNVFETEFQTAPLDLFTDAFYAARASEINHRLVEISNGAAPGIVRAVWRREGERRTCVVGLNWDYGEAVMVEIARCWEGEALATVCKVLCQEYRQRQGGMPDLFLWRTARREGEAQRGRGEEAEGEGEKPDAGSGSPSGEIMFAEVKSENDRLSDTQRLWIHVLTGAGVRVELCAARDGAEEEQAKTKPVAKSTT